MLSRVASNTFWMGRYLVRAEDLARAMTVHDRMLMDLNEDDRASSWFQLVAMNSSEELFAKQLGDRTEENILHFLVTSMDNPSSIVSSLANARYNLRACRSTLSRVMYELINELCLEADDLSASRVSDAERRLFLRHVENQLLAVSGAANGSMSYNQAFLFMRLGGFLERADMTSRNIDVRSALLLNNASSEHLTAHEDLHWVAILRSLQAFQMYMSEVRRPISGPEVLNFGLRDSEHPKSFRFNVQRTLSFLEQLPNSEKLKEKASGLLEKVDSADVRLLAKNQIELHRFIDELQLALADIANDIGEQYFPAKEKEQMQEQEQSQEQGQKKRQKQKKEKMQTKAKAT